MKRSRLAIGLLAVVALCGRAHAAPTRILVDSIHAHNFLHLGPKDDPYAYHIAYGYRRGFDYLKSRGVQVDEVTSGRIDALTLKQYQTVFINLPSGDLPLFQESEIVALTAFVQGGGGLFVVTDHSNCYYHAYKLQPLLERLGIRSHFVTACDLPPNTLGPGNGWLSVTRFKPHPVTQGLNTIGLETAGAVDIRYAVGLTSDKAWGDKWGAALYGENANQGNYGNWKQDKDEPSKTLGVLLAHQVGKGRVVIIGDQNLFGDPFINYEDNYHLWLNSIAWLTGRPDLASAWTYRAWKPHRVLLYEQPGQSVWADTSLYGYYNLFVSLGRKDWTFASHDLSAPADLLIFAHNRFLLSDTTLAQVEAHLRRGHNVLVLGTINGPLRAAGAPSNDLLEELQARLGKATIQTDHGAQSLSWPGTGQVVVLAKNDPFQNVSVAAPEKAPLEAQGDLLDMLQKLISQAVLPAS